MKKHWCAPGYDRLFAEHNEDGWRGPVDCTKGRVQRVKIAHMQGP
jgi:hypothetical protein